MRLLVFVSADTGFGHLRVMDALLGSAPKKNNRMVVMEPVGRLLSLAHRFTSVTVIGKYLLNKFQYGYFEDIFTRLYRYWLITTAGMVRGCLRNIIIQNNDCEEIWIIATHFGIAHQVGAVKKSLAKETGKPINLIVQVTDDTSQHLWCISGSDLTFVPSVKTLKSLQSYARREKINFYGRVVPYPINLRLTADLPREFSPRDKVFREKVGDINVAVPVSGAAVGLGYLADLIFELKKLSERFVFWVLVKESVVTKKFVQLLSALEGVNLLLGKDDQEMIDGYNQMYEERVIHLEVTKPSEQAFKSLLGSTLIGGSLLLFTEPVGRQEKDNMAFLSRHGLLVVDENVVFARGIRLPKNPRIAANLIYHSANSGLFRQMSFARSKRSKNNFDLGEIGVDGASLFWQVVEKELSHSFI